MIREFPKIKKLLEPFHPYFSLEREPKGSIGHFAARLSDGVARGGLSTAVLVFALHERKDWADLVAAIAAELPDDGRLIVYQPNPAAYRDRRGFIAEASPKWTPGFEQFQAELLIAANRGAGKDFELTVAEDRTGVGEGFHVDHDLHPSRSPAKDVEYAFYAVLERAPSTPRSTPPSAEPETPPAADETVETVDPPASEAAEAEADASPEAAGVDGGDDAGDEAGGSGESGTATPARKKTRKKAKSG